ncbi:TetR/AcrR family transcriptional regulator [Nonomuraea sp. NPDC050556]|uniref:TetR/AcrR family transcriptional regulator n=1 Tax=Nonomuraea sp. NPDC050556 TaxID=3364369 RepID=UPI0037A7CA53
MSQERADRILDVAKDLLLRWGYRRVTVDEVAKRAGVGKGTVYLHWRSREQMFLAVGAREAVEMFGAVVSAMRADPAEVMLHRYMRRFFVEAMRRPVLRALFTRDEDTLGDFLASSARQPLDAAKLSASHEYLGVLAAHGLLREGVRPEDLDYSLPAIVFGFFAIDPFVAPLALEAKADHLADTLRRTFEPASAPDAAACAPQVIEIFERLGGSFAGVAYNGGK